MKVLARFFLGLAACAAATDPPIPLPSGEYEFTRRFAEHPTFPSIHLKVHINGPPVIVFNPKASETSPAGVLDGGTLMWHAESEQWIIGGEEADRLRRDVGDCSGGPEVIDLRKRVYWAC